MLLQFLRLLIEHMRLPRLHRKLDFSICTYFQESKKSPPKFSPLLNFSIGKLLISISNDTEPNFTCIVWPQRSHMVCVFHKWTNVLNKNFQPNRHFDFINIMTYDYHGHWDPVTGHNSPLYESAVDSGIQLHYNIVRTTLSHLHLSSRLLKRTQWKNEQGESPPTPNNRGQLSCMLWSLLDHIIARM